MPEQGMFEHQILVVDDDEHVRFVLSNALDRVDGLTVVVAGNSLDALAMAREQPFDLLLTDLVMPAKGGRELIDALRASHPGLKAIAFTGYAVEDDLHEITVDVLQKPLDIETLGQAVRQALDAE